MRTQRDYSNFKGKKILFLGAHALTVHLIQKAKEMGMYTIVTDYIKDAPAKLVADQFYDISTLDIDALVEGVYKENFCKIYGGTI